MRFMRLRIFRCHSVGLDSWFFSLSFRLFFVRILVYSLRYASTNASFTLCAVYSITKLQIAKPKTTSSLNVQRIEIYICACSMSHIILYFCWNCCYLLYVLVFLSLSLFFIFIGKWHQCRIRGTNVVILPFFALAPSSSFVSLLYCIVEMT